MVIAARSTTSCRRRSLAALMLTLQHSEHGSFAPLMYAMTAMAGANLETCQHVFFPVYLYTSWPQIPATYNLYIYIHMLMFCYICPHTTAINYMQCSSLDIMTWSICQASVNHHELVQETRRCIQTFQKLKSQEATSRHDGTGVPNSRGTLWLECGRYNMIWR